MDDVDPYDFFTGLCNFFIQHFITFLEWNCPSIHFLCIFIQIEIHYPSLIINKPENFPKAQIGGYLQYGNTASFS